MTRIIAVANLKGGSAKTATATNLAAAYGETGEEALVVDLDGQGNASSALGEPGDGAGLLSALTNGAGLADLIQKTKVPGVYLVPGGLALNGLDGALAAMPDKAVAKAPAFLLRRLLRPVAGAFGLVLIDCPPALGTLTWNALVAATELLIPVEPHGHSVEAVARMAAVYDETRTLNPELSRLSIAPCRVDARTRIARGVIEALRERWPAEVLRSTVRACVHVAEAPLVGLPVVAYNTDSPATLDYRDLLDELVRQANITTELQDDKNTSRHEHKTGDPNHGQQEAS